eukprot:m.33517 g.33517  ORF g.33517 m.33517 type:complete len:532 (+) comp31839_c0_seq1:990-2585(+)
MASARASVLSPSAACLRRAATTRSQSARPTDRRSTTSASTNNLYFKRSEATSSSITTAAATDFRSSAAPSSCKAVTHDYACTTIQFNPNAFYPDKPIHALSGVDYRMTHRAANSRPTRDGHRLDDYVHDGTTVWIESIGHDNMTICAFAAGRGERHELAGNHQVTADFMIYQGAPAGAVGGTVRLSSWWGGTSCKEISLDGFSKVPSVLAAAKHGLQGMKHDAASLWIEDLTATSFFVCLRELQNFDGLHQEISVDWLAYDTVPSTVFSDSGSVDFEKEDIPDGTNNNALCQTVGFTRVYRTEPAVLVTASHSTTGWNRPAIYNDIITWVEWVTRTEFRLCLKEVYEHDPITVFYAVLPDACGDGWLPFDGYCYRPSSSCKDWPSASLSCTSQEAHLSSIHNEREAYFVGTLSGYYAWIGLRSDNTSSAVGWSDGSPLDYTHYSTPGVGDALSGDDDVCAHTLDERHFFKWNERNALTVNFTFARKSWMNVRLGRTIVRNTANAQTQKENSAADANLDTSAMAKCAEQMNV